MYGSLTSGEVRSFFLATWKKRFFSHSLTPIEQVAVGWISLHPEYHDLMDRRDAIEQEYTPQRGETNPFLHLSMHLAISEQVAADSPRGIKDAYHFLIRELGSEHAASHEIMECLGEVLWRSQRSRRPIDFARYESCIKRLGNRKHNYS